MTHTRPDIAAVLEAHGATVPRRSGWVPIKCPYHDDRNASASVHLDKQAFKCHSCDVKGDSYSLIQHHEGCDFKQALTIGDNLTPSSHPAPTKKRLEPLFG